jgi:hypothetical protein
MRAYFAYRPGRDGRYPLGTEGKLLFKLKTDQGAVQRARKVLGPHACVFTYSNFYDNKTFRLVAGTCRVSDLGGTVKRTSGAKRKRR